MRSNIRHMRNTFRNQRNSARNNAISDGCSTVSYKWDWMGLGWISLGGVRYRAPYGANKVVGMDGRGGPGSIN